MQAHPRAPQDRRRLVAQSKYDLWRERYGLEYLRRLAEEGLAEEEIATRSGLRLATFRRWKREHTEFFAALELGRSGSDYAVVESIYKRATGYSVKLNKTVKLKRVDYDPETGKKIREYEELATGVDENYVPGDLKAETFWLKNRQPERWQDRSEKESDGEESAGGIVEIPMADMIDAPSDAD